MSRSATGVQAEGTVHRKVCRVPSVGRFVRFARKVRWHNFVHLSLCSVLNGRATRGVLQYAGATCSFLWFFLRLLNV